MGFGFFGDESDVVKLDPLSDSLLLYWGIFVVLLFSLVEIFCEGQNSIIRQKKIIDFDNTVDEEHFARSNNLRRPRFFLVCVVVSSGHEFV